MAIDRWQLTKALIINQKTTRSSGKDTRCHSRAERLGFESACSSSVKAVQTVKTLLN